MTDLVLQLEDDQGEPAVGQVLEVPYFLVQWQLLKVEVQRVVPQLVLQPAAWRVWGVDQHGRGVAVYVHRRFPDRPAAARIGNTNC